MIILNLTESEKFKDKKKKKRMTSIKKTIKGICHKPKQSQIMSQDPTDTDQWKNKAQVFWL